MRCRPWEGALPHFSCSMPLGKCFLSRGPRQLKPDPGASAGPLQSEGWKSEAVQCPGFGDQDLASYGWLPMARPAGGGYRVQAFWEKGQQGRCSLPNALVPWKTVALGTTPLPGQSVQPGAHLPLPLCVCVCWEAYISVFQEFGSLCTAGICWRLM